MPQRFTSLPIPPGLLRPLAILLIALGVIGFVVATVIYNEQVLCLLGSTVLALVGLGMVRYARRLPGEDDPRENGETVWQVEQAPTRPRPPIEGGIIREARETQNATRSPENRETVFAQKYQLQEPPLDPQSLSDQVFGIFHRKGAVVEVEASREDRSILNVQTADGARFMVLVIEAGQPVDLPEARALQALVNEHNSDRGYLVSFGGFTERTRSWAQSRGFKLVGEGELWKLGMGM